MVVCSVNAAAAGGEFRVCMVLIWVWTCRVGKRSFPVSIFLKDASATDFARLGGTFSHLVKTFPVGLDVPDVEWEESCMDEGDNVVRHGGKLKPACCSDVTLSGLVSDSKSLVRASSKMVAVSAASGVSERASSPISSNYTSGRSCEGCEEDKASSSGRVDMSLEGGPVSRSYKRQGFKPIKELSEAIREEELLDIMLLLYHLGLAQNFKQVRVRYGLVMKVPDCWPEVVELSSWKDLLVWCGFGGVSRDSNIVACLSVLVLDAQEL